MHTRWPLVLDDLRARRHLRQAGVGVGGATGWAYRVTTRDPIAGGETTFADNAEDLATDPARTHLAVSFSSGPLAGIWVSALQ